ncbi:uncharacterized protein with ParB-like and HNH nuclease domain [Parabacteroides sp. PFB2-12]|uniref:DUF262 domain-containing protein n=1 Tax=unclassified Parabacteroides TaxID=2649774 RepID=UPI002474F87B|nr:MULTISPECIES: DUF262 domain-containing protein [unclassified Parabacteroides]MDH6343741.1 uncharacterized protein with ParB-like and HNH nuclease domain [Parabacteroides sp. PM6-13]MDH6391903.1 uncharacterized protein with ParB-like and HNH nuclease domain [Parabacteroides sp. PFB2-12]
MDKLELIPVTHLLNKNFFIPAYQRGYRWKERQVLDLLEDILEFYKKDKEKGEFYCLQPVVVTLNSEGEYEVIDGQQRLTTLYILLSYLEEARKIIFNASEKFTLSYETREKGELSSKEFLENILHTTEVNNRNIDFYHMSKAYLTIKKWFEDNTINKSDILNVLLKADSRKDAETGIETDTANNIRFIWYQLEYEDENQAKNTFTRINMGKIPLNNAELIKALFFINGSHHEKEKEKHQQKLAYEWDKIENTLQNENFWFFLNKSHSSEATKIEFIFDLIAAKYKDRVKININKSIDKLYTFYVFNELISKEIVTKENLWEEVKTHFRTFEEWYNDNNYYHLIGYLIQTGKAIEDIKLLSDNATKSQFRKELTTHIKTDIENKLKKEKITKPVELTYNENYNLVTDILLLFNVISTMNSGYSRFPFERYVTEKWSLEHIHAQNSEDLRTDAQRKALLNEQQVFFKSINDEDITTRINQLLSQNTIDTAEFANLQEEIFRKFTGDEDTGVHSIDNLALLTGKNNSTLNNNVFPIKRDKIIQLDEKGAFIPLCTKNVFLKYYSKDVTQNATWTANDRREYLNEIENVLTNFLPQ